MLNNEIYCMILSKYSIVGAAVDIEQAKTFLAIVETGSFLEAADKVYVTQSTVSARIKALENRLGKTLFERNKSGATLTPEGQQFLKHADAMVRIWESARLEISLPKGFETSITIGGQYSLWDGFLIDWLAVVRSNYPQYAVRAKFGFSVALMTQLINGSMDIGIMYAPQSRPGFEVEHIFDDEIILVASDPGSSKQPARNYVMIDWGPEFLSDHALNYPDISVPGTHLELGALATSYLIKSHSSGYVPRRLAEDFIKSKRLFEIEDAPVFRYPVYAVYSSENSNSALQTCLSELKKAPFM